MNPAALRCLFAILLASSGSAWSLAQEETPKPKPSSKAAAQDTGAKAAPSAKAKAAQDAKTKAWETKARARAKASAEARARAIDVNHASKADLKKLPGVTDALADAIIAKRPYKVKADLVVKQALPMDLYQTLRKQVKVAAK